MVCSRFSDGLLEVLSWFAPGLVIVCSRFSDGLLEDLCEGSAAIS